MRKRKSDKLKIKNETSKRQKLENENKELISDLPNSNQLKQCTADLNARFDIQDAPEGIVGVQQKIKPRLHLLLTNMVKNAKDNDKPLPNTIRIKLTGDGTQISRGLSVVNFAFTILEESHSQCLQF